MIDNNNEKQLVEVGNICHKNKISFIKGEIRGLFANIFVDFGEGFIVADTDGEESPQYVISGISNGEKTVFTTSEDDRIDFQTDDEVELKEIASEDGLKGFGGWNGRVFKVKVNGPYEFEIQEDSSKFGNYLTGGTVKKLKKHKTINFVISFFFFFFVFSYFLFFFSFLNRNHSEKALKTQESLNWKTSQSLEALNNFIWVSEHSTSFSKNALSFLKSETTNMSHQLSRSPKN